MCSIYSNRVGSGNNRLTMAVEYRPPIKLKEVRPESILFLWCSPNGSHKKKKNLIVPYNIQRQHIYYFPSLPGVLATAFFAAAASCFFRMISASLEVGVSVRVEVVKLAVSLNELANISRLVACMAVGYLKRHGAVGWNELRAQEGENGKNGTHLSCLFFKD